MKKILVVLLFLMSSCALQEKYIVKEMKEEIITIQDEYELVYLLDKNVMQNKLSIQYYSKEDIDLKEVIKLLSFINPFDLKLKKYTVAEGKNEYQVLELEYMEDHIDKTLKLANDFIEKHIKSSMSIREKTNIIHDYILSKSEYNESITKRLKENESAFQVYGVMNNGEAVCTGYARTYLLLCRLADVPVVYVPSDVMNHSFNLVYDDEFRYVDVTWDETNNDYHNVPMDIFFKDDVHEMDEKYNHDFFMGYMIYMYQLKL